MVKNVMFTFPVMQWTDDAARVLDHIRGAGWLPYLLVIPDPALASSPSPGVARPVIALHSGMLPCHLTALSEFATHVYGRGDPDSANITVVEGWRPQSREQHRSRYE
jgi:hypothetical protein